MCFSASASFIAGTSLSAVGVAALKRTEARTERPFAMIPMLFGIQQMTEGIIWLIFRCFFAAILSLLIYLHLRFRTLGGFQEEPVLSPAIVRSGESHAEHVTWRTRGA